MFFAYFNASKLEEWFFPIDKQRDIEKERNNTNVSNFYLNFKIKILNSNLLINEKKDNKKWIQY